MCDTSCVAVACDDGCLPEVSSGSLRLAEVDDGFSSIVWESSDIVEWASLSARFSVCDEEASGLPDRCCEGDGRR